MTDAEIEAIARLYCRKLGLDPDQMQVGGWKRWMHYRSDVRAALSPAAGLMREAIADVLGEKGSGPIRDRKT